MEAWAWVIQVGAFGRAILVHEFDVVRCGDMCIKRREICPRFLISREGHVVVVWDMCDEGADSVIVEVHRIDVARGKAANAVDDDIKLVGGCSGVEPQGAVALYTI